MKKHGSVRCRPGKMCLIHTGRNGKLDIAQTVLGVALGSTFYFHRFENICFIFS